MTDVNTYTHTGDKTRKVNVRRGSRADLALDADKQWKRTSGKTATDDHTPDGIEHTTAPPATDEAPAPAD